MIAELSVEGVVARRNVSELLHFTSNHGLVGILEIKSILSRRTLPEEDHLAHIAAPTSAARQEAESYFDKQEDWLDYINLSISEINRNYFKFASERWHTSGDRWWVILSFRPSLLSQKDVYFSTTNNVYPETLRAKGGKGLEALFAESIARKPGWTVTRKARSDNLPTCEQAEVLFPSRLDLSYLQAIYVANEDHSDLVEGWLSLYKISGVSVRIDASKFNGQPN
ncbi:DarT ssDNA thymidine ADP-ribosyltransferase family protein [Pseudomonas syringae]|uniref:DarT domain-containing protein n=1 Tax=Pseudomonas syringae pv. actinidiae TaxID=103796 RepID=A0A7Z6U312_PSESF|nr:DarT ssDNA thymidine ADP-ribosyltransferase family protein [Pseudomonas syringae]RMP75965.1 hypothetical protein ALQ15_02239 [Pseudomonas syringae pv. actinidiae]